MTNLYLVAIDLTIFKIIYCSLLSCYDFTYQYQLQLYGMSSPNLLVFLDFLYFNSFCPLYVLNCTGNSILQGATRMIPNLIFV